MSLKGFTRVGHWPTLLAGVVGAAGGPGGFFLPSALGAVRDAIRQAGVYSYRSALNADAERAA